MRRNEFHLRTRFGLVSILVLAAMAQIGLAQETTGAITGKITDPSGAAIAGAAINVKDVDRGTVWRAQTSEEGLYNLPRLPIGRYELRVEAPGFQAAVRSAFNLELSQTAKIDIAMTLGAVSQSVEVTGAAPLLQTESTTLSTIMQAGAIGNLPLETRNYNQLALLTPGAVTTSPGAFNTGQQTFNSGRPYINGNREQANYYLLDGMDNNEFVDNNVAFSPNVDAIQEINIVANNPSAEYGQFLGGVISVSLKSGTNQFHGTVFEFLRNDFFNANEWSRNFSSDPTINSAPANLRWNQFGFTFGGPIKKNKLFFFSDFQGSRIDTPPTSATISTFTAKELTGNFSELATQLHYPGTTIAIPGNNFANATICGAGQQMGVSPCITGLSKTALAILSSPLFPKATLPGLVNNATNVQSTYIHGLQGDAKVDWSPTDKDHLFVRYSQQYVENPTTNSQPLLYNSTGNNVFPLWNGVIDHTHTISSSLLNDFRFGVNYYPAEGNTQSPGANNAGALIPGEPTKFLPGIAFIGSNVGGGNNGPFPVGTVDSGEIFHQTAIQFEDTLIWNRGAHTMKMGFQGLRYRNDFAPTSADGAAGQINFNGQYTGDAQADFLLGLPNLMGLGSGGAATVGQRNNSFGAFFQDDWKVSRRLTVNLGMRWQLITPIYEVHNRETNFNLVTGQIELAGQDGNSRALYNQYNGIANFLPRLGVAWTPFNDSTVIRAAFSRSSFQEGTGEFNRVAVNAPWNSDLIATMNAGANGSLPSNLVTLDQGFTGLGAAAAAGGTPCTVLTVLSTPASCFAGQKIHAQNPDYRPAVSNQWNVTIQHQFGNATTLQAAYVGQHTDHLTDILFGNQKELLPNGTAVAGPYFGGNPALKAMIGQGRINETNGYQNYNALQLALQRRIAKGLAFQMNFTWSKCLADNMGYYARYGDSTGSLSSGDHNFQQNVYNLSQDYGLCSHDVSNLASGFLTYDLPFGKGRTFAKSVNKTVDSVIGGWQANAILTAHGGFPITMFDFADPSGTGSAEPRPSCIAPSRQTPYQNFGGGGYIWFDPSTMAAPAAGTFGNCGIGSERGPGRKQLDFSMSKHFMFTERVNLEFRAEAINAFNTPQFTLNAFSIDVFGGANEGVVNNSLGARNLQFALRLSF